VIGLWFWGFERASQNGKFRVFNLLGHLRMAEILVDNDTSDQLSIIELSSDLNFDEYSSKKKSYLSEHFDEFEIDIFLFEICDGKNGFDGDVGKLIVTSVYNFGAESSPSSSLEHVLNQIVNKDGVS
jgi:hypothetical protein